MQTRAAHTRLAFMPAVAVAFCFAGAAVAASAELGRLPSVDAFKKITLDDAVRKAASDIVPESWLVPAYDSNEWSFDQAAGTDKWAILVLASGEGKPMETITQRLMYNDASTNGYYELLRGEDDSLEHYKVDIECRYKGGDKKKADCTMKYYKGRELAAPAVPEKTDSGEFAIDRVTIEGPA